MRWDQEQSDRAGGLRRDALLAEGKDPGVAMSSVFEVFVPAGRYTLDTGASRDWRALSGVAGNWGLTGRVAAKVQKVRVTTAVAAGKVFCKNFANWQEEDARFGGDQEI